MKIIAMTIVAREWLIREFGVEAPIRFVQNVFLTWICDMKDRSGTRRQIILHEFDDGSGVDKCMHVSSVHVTCTVG